MEAKSFFLLLRFPLCGAAADHLVCGEEAFEDNKENVWTLVVKIKGAS